MPDYLETNNADETHAGPEAPTSLFASRGVDGHQPRVRRDNADPQRGRRQELCGDALQFLRQVTCFLVILDYVF